MSHNGAFTTSSSPAPSPVTPEVIPKAPTPQPTPRHAATPPAPPPAQQTPPPSRSSHSSSQQDKFAQNAAAMQALHQQLLRSMYKLLFSNYLDCLYLFLQTCDAL